MPAVRSVARTTRLSTALLQIVLSSSSTGSTTAVSQTRLRGPGYAGNGKPKGHGKEGQPDIVMVDTAKGIVSVGELKTPWTLDLDNPGIHRDAMWGMYILERLDINSLEEHFVFRKANDHY